MYIRKEEKVREDLVIGLRGEMGFLCHSGF